MRTVEDRRRAEERAVREVQPVEDQRRDLEAFALQLLVDARGQAALDELEDVSDEAAREVSVRLVTERQDPLQCVQLQFLQEDSKFHWILDKQLPVEESYRCFDKQRQDLQ